MRRNPQERLGNLGVTIVEHRLRQGRQRTGKHLFRFSPQQTIGARSVGIEHFTVWRHLIHDHRQTVENLVPRRQHFFKLQRLFQRIFDRE